MATVRRRVAPYLTGDGLPRLRAALVDLLDGHREMASADARMARFIASFSRDREHRWVRDFAAEVLHNVAPEQYPLMTRWVWDAEANTGALRELWFGDDVDRQSLAVADDHATFVVLREELALYLAEHGFYRDVPFYVDLLLAQVYAAYVAAQGGSFLRADFSQPEDPMLHTRRMLGLDGVRTGTSRTRLKAVDGSVYHLCDEPP